MVNTNLEAVDLVFTAIGRAGEVLWEVERTMVGRGNGEFMVSELFSEIESRLGDIQTLRVESENELHGFSFRRRNDDLSDWKNTSQFISQWSMKYDENFYVFIDVECCCT